MASGSASRDVVVFGASSQIGYFLLKRLVARKDGVVAVSRKARPAEPGITWVEGDLPWTPPALDKSFDCAASFGPLAPFAAWLEQAPLRDDAFVVATSSMSAATKIDSPVLAERELAQRLREGESQLAQACERRGFRWTILRPTIVYGAARDKSLTPIARRAARTHVFPWPQGKGLRQPVHADDIAQAVLAAIDTGACAGQVVPIGGGERLTAGQMFDRVRRTVPGTVLPVPLPAAGLELIAMAVPWMRGPVARLNSDLIADNSVLEASLGVHPRPFRPDPACWGL
ncbi:MULTISPECIES: SDR family oxidoreductase [Dyella]|uniref:NAD-dependent epimerase/dehydratase family protein n=2 Tax=Dyella TaxID=231454 RepID=A0A4R0YK66_9GAMM|nr:MULTISPECIES: NAD-dependent epimerase/dehydratase family protein [Dyella]TBR37112.1 NAD-dependent epimerase/dehydratase family protein [Dyella terrae]TCI07798.1 NAD-dependent epimerase/dehydratase family protein [Dyella soli]